METGKLLQKARRLREEGKVHIMTQKDTYTSAEVEGDHNTYTVMIWFDEKQSISKAKCGCPWNVLRHSGKWCSHIRAVLSHIGITKVRSEFGR